MSGHYMRKCTTAKLGQLQRKSRYEAAKAPTRSSEKTNAARATTPLRSSSRVERDTTFPQRPAEQTTRVLSSDRRTTRGTNPLPSPVSTIRDYAPRSSSQMMIPPETPRSDRKREPKHTNNTSLQYHVVRIAQGIWTLFKNTPPWPRLACIFLGIGLLLLLSQIASIIIQISTPLFYLVYLILGIIAPGIVIYEFLNKKNESGTKLPDRHVE